MKKIIILNKEVLSKIVNISKALAILGIVFYHFFVDLGNHDMITTSTLKAIELVSKVGSQGVLFFFFASGFGLMYSSLKNDLKIEKTSIFLKKRLWKLYPPYLLAIIIVWITYITLSIELNRVYFFSIISDILLLRNFSIDTIHGLNGNWWFIATLVQLYILYMLFSKFLIRFKWFNIIILGFIIEIAYKFVLISINGVYVYIDASTINPYTTFFLNYIASFFLGVGISKYIYNNQITITVNKIIGIFFLIIVFEYIGYSLSFSTSGKIINDIFFLLSYIPFLLISSYLILNKLKKIIIVFTFISSISYEIYLLHHPMIKVSIYLLHTDNILYILIFFVFLIIVLAYLLNRIVRRIK